VILRRARDHLHRGKHHKLMLVFGVLPGILGDGRFSRYRYAH